MDKPACWALALCLAFVMPGMAALEASEAERPVELGAIDWLRDFDGALEQARKSGKPMLVLFQEVPG